MSGSASAMPSRSTRPAHLARREGMLVGGSSGTDVAAALRYAQRLDAASTSSSPWSATPAATT